MPLHKAKSWALIPTAWMSYFTYTRLILCLDLLPVIGIQNCIASISSNYLWGPLYGNWLLTLAPRLESSRAVSKPIPEFAPVTTATCPSNLEKCNYTNIKGTDPT